MKLRTVVVRINAQRWHLALTDFNRLRWTLAALPLDGESVPAPAANGPNWLVDSTWLLRHADAPVPDSAVVVLWDGYNSLVELHDALPALTARRDLQYRFVGAFADLVPAFPSGSAPLLPNATPAAGAAGRGVRAPAWIGALALFRALVRPLKNARQAPELHRRMTAGGHVVFCGLVRPTADVLDGFLRGSALQAIRPALAPLVGLDWRRADAAAVLAEAYEVLRASHPGTPADLAAAYSVASVLHRMGTLAALHAADAPLLVNEFGMQAHFDPYDARAYGRNLFLDFGSTRGGDALYPRTLDLRAQCKRYTALRWLLPGQSLRDWLPANDAASLIALCGQHAREVMTQAAAGVSGARA
jgi:hypothetical protein